MEINKLSPREKGLFFTSIGMVIFYLFFQYLLSPGWEESARLSSKAESLRIELKITEAKIKILEALKQKAASLPSRPLASRNERALEVLQQLSQAAAKSNLSLTSIRPLIDFNSDGIKFMLTCSGRYKNLYNFLSSLNQQQIPVLVDVLDLSTSDEIRPTIEIKMTLTAAL